MKTIVLARKPLVGTVASNVLKHGCGGLNINKTRIDLASGDDCSRKPIKKEGCKGSGGWKNVSEYTGTMNGDWKKGRWPANLILQHLDGCRCDGIKKVKGSNPFTSGGGVAHKVYGVANKVYGPYGNKPVNDFTAPDGKESVANWICELGCPVKALDNQSGVSTSGSIMPHHRRNVPRMGHGGVYGDENLQETPEVRFVGDTGGASRFFKQVKQ